MLYYALWMGFDDVAKLLIEAGEDATARTKGMSLLYPALICCNEETVKMVTQRIADSSTHRLSDYSVHVPKMLTPLHVACAHGRVKLARYFLSQGVAVNALDVNWWTALRHVLCTGSMFYASGAEGCRMGRPRCAATVEIVKLLVEYGADPDLRMVLGWDGQERILHSTAANMAWMHPDETIKAVFADGNEESHKPKFCPYELRYLRGAYHQSLPPNFRRINLYECQPPDIVFRARSDMHFPVDKEGNDLVKPPKSLQLNPHGRPPPRNELDVLLSFNDGGRAWINSLSEGTRAYNDFLRAKEQSGALQVQTV